jgi:filamentous hemagglutinin family protein
MKKVTSQTLIFIATFMSFLVSDRTVQAQISSDGTLPTNVRRSGSAFEITGGRQAGGNLFHSFKEFSVPRGGEAFFKKATNASNVANIISRVTGGSISNIDGLIRENYGANVILINPSGINFGANARLQIGGSFLVSTSDSLKFADGTVFSATNPQAEPLLTVSVPIGLQFGQNPAPIRVRGSGHDFTVRDPIFSPVTRSTNPTGLQVSSGETLALVGGEIELEGGNLTAEGGRIELGSVADGLVDLKTIPQGWALDYQGVSNFQDIEMRSQALVDASSNALIPGGSIHLQGRNLSIRDGSLVLIQNQGTQPAGRIEASVSESVIVSGTNTNGTLRSSLTNESVGTGAGGNINISSRRLVVKDGATIVAKTFSGATGGNIHVKASDSLQVTGASDRDPSVTSSIVAATFGRGNSGHNTVSTGRLRATAGGTIATATFGAGRGGNLNVKAADAIEIVGGEPNSFLPSGLIASAFNSGDAGNLTVDTQKLAIRNGGGIIAVTLASGSAGSIAINASESVAVIGIAPTAIAPSSISSSANVVDPSIQKLFGLPSVPSGRAGDVTIDTNRLRVTDGALIAAASQGRGDAGSVSINAGSIFLSDRAGITAATLPNIGGRSGSIVLQARDSIQAHKDSQISNINGGSQAAGNLTLDTGRLIFSDGSFAATTALGRGAGGNLIVRASESVELAGDGFEAYQEAIGRFLTGTSTISDIRNGLFTGTGSGGGAGNLTIETQQLSLSEGALILTSTFGAGDGGDISIKANRGIDLSGSGLASTTSTNRPAGRVTLDTSNLTMRNGGAIVTATLGDGRGGDLTVNASESVELSNTPVGAITPTGMFTNSVTGTGRAGNLTINTQRLVVRDGSGISTQSGALTRTGAIATGGAGGNLSIDASEGIELIGVSPDSRFESTLNTSTFSASPAGNLNIKTGKLSVRDGARVGASTFAGGAAGNVTINASEFVEVTGTSRTALPSRNPSTIASSAIRRFGSFPLPRGASGNVTIKTGQLRVTDGALITTSNDGRGLSGNIKLDASSIVLNNTGAITAELGGTNRFGRPIAFSRATVGGNRGGKIEMATQQLTLENVGEISTSTFTNAAGGDIQIDASESLLVKGFLSSEPRLFSSIGATTFGSGDSGNINISTGRLAITNRGSITAGTLGTGSGGDVTIDATQSVEVSGVEPTEGAPSILAVSTFNRGRAGNLTINAPKLIVRDGGRIDSSTLAQGAAGNITINASESVEVSGTAPGRQERSQIVAGATIESEIVRRIFNLPDVPSGTSGNVTIDTGRLVVAEGAQINVTNEGIGDAGRLDINARSVSLDNDGSLTAATQSGRGGNIELQVRDSLQMLRGSTISAQAGGTSQGGNISINAGALLLFENSNIFASAIQGRGGRIDISTQGLFQCADCQISAASEVGLDGVVEVFTPDVDTNLEVLDVPEQVTQPDDVVAFACAAGPRQTRSEFTITGRGGLPPRPNEALSSEALVSFGSSATEATSTGTAQAADASELPPPARGWYVNDRGTVVLAAQAPAASPYSSGLTSQNCRSK